jgi:hypothetical protein
MIVMPQPLAARRRVAVLTVIAALTACSGGMQSGGAGNGAAYTELFETLGRPAGLTIDGDSAVVVTRIVTPQMRGVSRLVAARVTASTVARNWPSAHLTHVTVVFRDLTRLGPFTLWSHDEAVRIDDRTPVENAAAPAGRLP